jgi:hypothetical protein
MPRKQPRIRTMVALAAALSLIAGGLGDARSATALIPPPPSCSGVIPTAATHRGCLVTRDGELAGPAPAPPFRASQLAALPVIALPAGRAAKVKNDSLSGVAQGVLGTLANPAGAGAGALAGLGLNALDSWVLKGAGAALTAAATAIATTTAPQLQSTWFSSMYWRVAGLGALLTLPFLFAAAAQALLRSDLSLLARAAFGYLPLSLLGVSLAAPLTMLLLAATDQMCAVVAGIGQNGGAHFLASAALAAGGASALDGSPFLAFLVGLVTVAAAIALLVELLIREAAVYVVVLMLPLAFAAFVWPARRSLAVRTVEVLIALIFSKFVVVAVLSLGGAAFGQGTHSSASLLTATALVLMSTFAPVALFRLIPFAELAAGTSGAVRSELPRITATARTTGGLARAAGGYLGAASDWLADVPAQMRDQAREAGQAGGRAPARPELRAGATQHTGLGGDVDRAVAPEAGRQPRVPDLSNDPAGVAADPDPAPVAAGADPASAAAGADPASAASGADPASVAAGVEPAPAAAGADPASAAAGADPAPAAAGADPASVAAGADPASAAAGADPASVAAGADPASAAAGADPAPAASHRGAADAAPAPLGMSRGEPADGLEAALQADNLTIKLRLGMEDGWRPEFGLADAATGGQSGLLDWLPGPQPQPDEGGSL